MTTFGRVVVPGWAWARPEVRRALGERDVSALLRAAQRYTGASQSRLAAAVGVGQGRVNEIIRGRRTVAQLDVLERIADGLSMPDAARQLFGLAAHDAVAPEIVRVYNDQAEAAEDIRRAASEAVRVDVLAVRGLGLVGLNDSLLRGPLRESGDGALRALLLHPDSGGAERRAAEIGETFLGMASGIRLATERLAALSRDGLEVQVYWYRQVPTWRMIALDETMFVSVFDTSTEGHAGSLYQLVPAPRCVLYRGYRRMFEALRVDAERVV